MTVIDIDLGEAEPLVVALGLATRDDDGDLSFNGEWLSNPSDSLTTILTNGEQRKALEELVDLTLGSIEPELPATDGGTATWLPLVDSDSLTLAMVVETVSDGVVDVGLGVRAETRDPLEGNLDVHVPLFRIGAAASERLLLGGADGTIRISGGLTNDSGTPIPGEAFLGGIALSVTIPTDGTSDPTFGFTLRQLQLPGGDEAADYSLNADSADGLDDELLELVVALIEAQAEAVGGAALTRLAALLGVGPDAGAITPLPFAAIVSGDGSALTTWFSSLVSSSSALEQWIEAWAELLGGSRSGTALTFDVGAHTVSISFAVATNADGQTVITPTVAAAKTGSGGDVAVRAEVGLASVNLSTGAVVALPIVSVVVDVGPTSGTLFSTGSGAALISAQGIICGLSLDADRRLQPLLQVRGATIANTTHPILDLSSPQQVADAAETAGQAVLDAAVDELQAQLEILLGDFASLLTTAIGFTPPAGVSALDIAEFLSDPLGALVNYWRDLLRGTDAGGTPHIITVLQPLLELLIDGTGAAPAITGSGTVNDPWRLALIGELDLTLWREVDGNPAATNLDSAADTLTIGVEVSLDTPVAVSGGATVGGRVRASLARINLVNPGVALAAELTGELAIAGVDNNRVRVTVNPDVALEAASCGLAFVWSPDDGLAVRPNVDDLVLRVGSASWPVDLATLLRGDFSDLDDPAWAAIEHLAQILVDEFDQDMLRELAELFGWNGGSNRLPLRDLIDDPVPALQRWLVRLVEDANEDIESFLALISRGFADEGGNGLSTRGVGTWRNPWRVGLVDSDAAPSVALWTVPDGALPAVHASTAIQNWEPGFPALPIPNLVAALEDEAEVAADVADLLLGRTTVAESLELLADVWERTDGLLRSPGSGVGTLGSPLDAVTVHELVDIAGEVYQNEIDVTAWLPAAADITIHVRVAIDADAETLWPEVDSDRLVDLSAATIGSLADLAASLPSAGVGDWYVALSARSVIDRLADDPDGTLSQVERLQVLIDHLSSLGTVALVGYEAAGHAARLAAQVNAAVDHLITAGTPWLALAPDSFDTASAGHALRLLRATLVGRFDDEPEDGDVGLIRALVNHPAITGHRAEFELTAGGVTSLRAGLDAHAIFGVLSAGDLARAMTAAVASGLAARARHRFENAPELTGAGFGVYLGIEPDAGTGALTADVTARVDVGHLDIQTGLPQLEVAPTLRVDLSLYRNDGWIIGGPDAPADVELRAVTAELVLPLGGASTEVGHAAIILHEPTIGGVRRSRWEVGVGLSDFGPDVTVTGVLPEVQQLLSHAVNALLDDPSVRNEAIHNALQALGLIVGDALPGDAVNELIHNPRGLVQYALANALNRDLLLEALAVLLGQDPGTDGVLSWPVGPITLTVDLAAGAVTLTGTSDADGPGVFGWDLQAALALSGAAPSFTASASVSAESSMVGEVALTAQVGSGLSTVGGSVTPRGADPLVFTLLPQVGGPSLASILQTTAPAVVTQLAFDLLQQTEPVVAGRLIPVLDALGLLEDLDDDPDVVVARRLRPLVELVNDAGQWVQDALGAGSGLSSQKLEDVAEAVKQLLDLPGPPGMLELAVGVTVGFGTDASLSELQVGIDTSAFSRASGVGLAAGLDLAIPLTRTGPSVPRFGLELDFLNSAGATLPSLKLTSSPDLRLSIERSPAVELYPNPDGLSLLLATATVAVVPMVLDAMVDAGSQLGASSLVTTAANIVSAAGDVLDLRTGGAFDTAKIQEFASDPVDALQQRSGEIAASAITQLAGAVGTATSGVINVTGSGTTLTIATDSVTAGPVMAVPVSVSMDFTTASLTVDVDVLDLGFLGDVQGRFSVTTQGAVDAALAVGPATIDVGGVELHPFLRVLTDGEGAPAAPQLDIGLADNGDARFGLAPQLAADGTTAAVWWRFGFDPLGAALLALNASGESDVGTDVALAGLDILTSLLLGYTIEIPAVQQLLDKPIGNAPNTTTLRDLLDGVLLSGADGDEIIDGPFDPSTALERLAALITNMEDLLPDLALPGGLTVGLSRNGNTFGVVLDIADRMEIASGDLLLWLDTDASWITGDPTAGVQLNLVEISGNTISFEPNLVVAGLGFGVGRSGRALIEGPVGLGSITVHTFADISESTFSGGVQLGLNEFTVRMQGAGGNNEVAQGVLNDANSGEQALAPTFSPRVAVQKHGSDNTTVGLSLGPDTGPWWLAVQKNFGPVYIEQVGVGVVVEEDDLDSISLYLDGRMSLFGLTASVDDLELRYTFGGSIFELDQWSVDVAGFGIAADVGGLVLTGGLAKFATTGGTEYIGMLMARFAVYGLSVFGGYGTATGADGKPFMSFFAFGAINGPIGGPPAFFLTGIGGGFGINRALEIPMELDQFASNPLIAALDPAAEAPEDPMAQLVAIRDMFPIEQGTFWFAAGISFTSFALVDGVAVVAVEIGDGLDLALLGLARLALPRPQFPLVSIELGLLARFSTSEGVLWIQAQLTDNSWLLHESVRLTGGFAFVMWFKGERQGQFVLTIGGYHPRFEADGYPEVPRLGFNWQVASNIVVKGGGYFALTSEALMAGGELVASATFGPAFAEVRFEAHGIVYFDPFFFEVEVSARISAGVTINLLFCKKTIRISLGARILVSGPRIFGEAEVEVGPVSLTVSFGDHNQQRGALVSWPDFVAKYLEQGSSTSSARAITAVAGRGSRPPGAEEGAEPGETPVADGSNGRPFEVEAEFELTLTTTVPIIRVAVEGLAMPVPAFNGLAVGAAPLGEASLAPVLDLSIDGDESFDSFGVLILDDGAFPAGVWAAPATSDAPSIPQGEVVPAANGAVLTTQIILDGPTPEMKAEQVEPGQTRHPLPLTAQAQERRRVAGRATGLGSVVSTAITSAGVETAHDALEMAQDWLGRGKLSATSLASYAGDRAAPPVFSSLGESIFGGKDQLSPGRATTQTRTIAPTRGLGAPQAVALFRSGGQRARDSLGTTVAGSTLARVPAPTMAGVTIAIAPVSAARLLVREPRVQTVGTTVRAVARPTTTGLNSASTLTRQGAARSRLGSGASVLDGLTASISEKAIGNAAELAPGESVIFDLPGSRYDRSIARPSLTSTETMRMVVLGAGGQVLLDTTANDTEVPQGADRLVMMNVGDRAIGAGSRAAGWHGSQSLPYLGWQSLLAHRAVVRLEDGGSRKRSFGWTPVSDLNRNAGRVVTRFADGAQTVAVALVGTSGEALADIALAVQPAAGSTSKTRISASDPVVLQDGPHATLIYKLTTEDGDGSGIAEAFQVTVSIGGGWRVAGVLAWDLPFDDVHAIVQSRPIASLATTPNGGGATSARIRWTPQERTTP